MTTQRKRQRILVTAGNAQVPIDQVCCISNTFKDQLGAQIANYLFSCGHFVHLLTSGFYPVPSDPDPSVFCLTRYKTYDDLMEKMEWLVRHDGFDTIIHLAIVPDYYVEDVCVEEEIAPDSDPLTWLVTLDISDKIGSDHECLYLRLKPTQKIIDLIRDSWDFRGTLVKFESQVGLTDEKLVAIAGKSMRHSRADVIIANCLEWSNERAFIITPEDAESIRCLAVSRQRLPVGLLDKLESIWEAKT